MKKFQAITTFFLLAVSAAALLPTVFSGRLVLPQGFVLGGFSFRWYGLILAASVLIGYAVARSQSWRFGISHKEVDDIAFWVTIVSLISARIYYVLSLWPYFSGHLSEVPKIWHGGLSIFGALIGGAIFLYLYGRNKIYSPGQLFDLAALGLPLSQAFGRLGNFVNYEAFGTPTGLPWKMFVPPAFRPEQFSDAAYFHPAFLYEMIVSLIIFAVLFAMLGKVRRGVIALSYLALYSLGRFFIEGIRVDSAFVGDYRIDQLAAFVGVVVPMFLILLVYEKARKEQGKAS